MKNLTIKSMAEKVMRRAAAGQSFSGAPQGLLSVGRNGCRSTFAQPSLNLRSSFAHRSLIVRFAAMFLMLMTMSIGQAWGAKSELINGQYLYCDVQNSNWTKDNANMRFNWFWNENDYCCNGNGSKLIGNIWYITVPNAYTRRIQMLRMSSDWSSQWNYSSQTNVSSRSNNNQNCVKITGTNWDNASLSWSTYVPPMSSLTIANNGTLTTGGDGSQVNPYIISGGTTIKVTASASLLVPDPNPTFKYKYSVNSIVGEYGTGNNTYEFTADAAGASAKIYEVTVRAYATFNSTDNSAINATNTVYFKVEADVPPCVTGEGFNIAQPGNGHVGDNFNMAPNIPGDVVGATVSYVCSPAGAVSFDGNTATYEQAANPVSITATLSGGNLCAPVEHTTNNFRIEVEPAPCVPTTYMLMHTDHGLIATFTRTANANEYELTFKLNNNIINNLYVEDDCRNRYGCSTAIQPGQSITLTPEQSTFNFQSASQDKHWHYIFNSNTLVLRCDANAEEDKVTTYLIQFFNHNGGAPLQSGRVEEGHTPSYTGATPTRESDAEWDYTFERWEPAIHAANENQNYSAVYTPTRREYTLTWNLDGGNITTPGTDAGSVANASTLTAPVVTKTGYTFAAWSPVVPTAMPAANSTYTATWTPITYDITYNLNGGAGATNRTYTIETETIVLPTPTKDGFSFVGWFDNSEFSGSAITQIASGSTGNKTFYAKWTEREVFIVGRFKVRASEGGEWIYTGSKESEWNAESEKIKMVADGDVYTLNTYATVKELSEISSEGWFSINEKVGATKTRFGGTNAEFKSTKKSTTLVKDNAFNTKFNDNTDNSGPVILTYNSTTHVLSYDAAPEVTNAVTINNGDHGTVSPTGSQQVGKSGISITATPADGYKFVRWEVTGGASVASETSATTTLTATAAGSVTATWATQEYMYIYAALATNWGASNLAIKYNGVEYRNSSSYFVHLFDGDKTLYDAPGSTATTQVDGKTYKVAIFKVPTEWADGSTHIYVGKDDYTYDAGVLQSGNGYLYYKNDSRAAMLESISIASVTVDKASYEPAEQVTCSLTLNDYSTQHKTAGADGLTYSYKLNNVTDGTSEVIAGQTSRTCKFQASSMLTVDKAYTITAVVKDNQTRKMVYEKTTDEFTAIAAVPRVSATAVSTLVLAGHDGQVKLDITTQNTAAGWKYSVKNETNDQWLAQNVDLPAESPFRWTATGSIPAGEISIKVYLYNESGVQQAVSEAVAVTAETAYGIAVNYTGQGSVTPAEVFASASVSSAEATATPASHYYFKEWTATENITIANASAATTTVTATQGGTLTANFTPSWSVRGNYNVDWNIANYIENYDGNTGYVDIVLAAGTHEFKVFHHGESYAYGNTGTMTRDGNSVQTGGWTMANDKGNCQIEADIAGTYRFSFNVDMKKLTVTYPTPQNYTITYNVNGGSEIAEHLTYTEVEATFSLPVPTRSGYWFHGWYTNEACTEGKTTEITKGTTGDKTFYAKWDLVGYYLNINLNPGGDKDWQKLYFEGGTLELSLQGKKFYEFSLRKLTENTESWYGIDKDNDNMRTIENDANWKFYSGKANVQLHTTIDGKYVFAVTDDANPQIQFTYPKWSCEFSIPALVNTLQPSTVSFTPNVVNYDVTGYELYYTNDGGANWTSCAGVSESAGTYSYTNTYATAGTYQLKVVVKNGDDQVGEPFLSETFEVVAPSINIGVSAYPRAEQTVTVTPTVTGLQSGEYHYCWSIVDQTIEFTDNGNGTFSFTAPEAGNYTLHMDVKPGENCEGAAIISKNQELEILGDEVVIKAGLEKMFWQGVKTFYDEHSYDMEDLGVARNGVHWYSIVVPSDKIGCTVLFHNSVDGSPQGGSTQTSNFSVPAVNTCYLIKSAFNNDEWGNRQCTTTDCPDGPEVEVTSTTSVVLNGQYHITANYFMIPGEVSYEYIVTSPSSTSVAVTDATFTASAEGNYSVIVVAKVGGVEKARSEAFTVTCVNASVSAAVSSANVNLNDEVTLTATTTNLVAPTYQWYVKMPGTTIWTIISGFTGETANYTVKLPGTYTFRVDATEDGVTLQSNQPTVTVTVPEKWIKYYHAEVVFGDSEHWKWEQMTYNPQDGCYWHLGYKSGAGVNICATATDDCGWKSYSYNATFFTIEDGVTDNAAVYFVYNPEEDHMYLKKAVDYYRVRSNTETGVYYSNIVALVDAQTAPISFFATEDATLELEKLVTTTWTKQGENLDNTSITADNVYTANLSTTALSDVVLYTGDFYIFSDVVGNKETCTDANKMQKFNNVDPAEFYNHYKCTWINDGGDNPAKNTGATVGNAINHNLAVTLPKDVRKGYSVRYAYKPETNHFSRAYLSGALGDNRPNDFLVVYGENVTKDDGTTIISAPSTDKSTSQPLVENSDWVYSTYIRATNPATIKLAARVDDQWQYLLDAGGSDKTSRDIYGVINEGEILNLRFLITYDFKTNRVIAAWAPDGSETYDHPITIDADLVVIRQSHNYQKPILFNLNGEGQVKLIRKIITVIEVDRDSLFTNSSALKHAGTLTDRLFQISLPYDVEISQVTGLDNYGTKVVMQSYLGEVRAALGWQSYIKDFWTNLQFNSTTKLMANRGYVISNLWNYYDFTDVEINPGEHIAKKRIFFPSETKAEGYIIGPVGRYAPTTFAALNCAINGREKVDSNWRLIGLPGFFPATVNTADPEGTETGKNDPETNEVDERYTLHWVYDWNGNYGSYTAHKATEFRFQPTKSYMVQYAGTVTWKDTTGVVESGRGDIDNFPIDDERPQSVAARRAAGTSSLAGEYRIELYNSKSQFEDQTFVVLDADATDEYEANLDLQKSFNDEATQIYSVTPKYLLAANTLSDTTKMVSLGTSLPKAGEYTIHLGKMSRGAQVPVLYDAQENTYSFLTRENYTFSGAAGRQDGRFYLVFGYRAPEITTNIEAAAGEDEDGDGVRKVLYDGQLYIMVGNNIYDANGKMVK